MTILSDSLTNDSGLDSLIGHSVPKLDPVNNGGDSLTTDSGLDSLMGHSVPVVVGLDWERDGWRVSRGGELAFHMTKAALLEEEFADVDLIIVEQAHMKERNVYSVAQIYTADELAVMACRAKIRLFPGMPGQLSRAAREVGNVKKDEKGEPILERVAGTDHYQSVPDKRFDAETMAKYAALHPDKVRSWKKCYLNDEDPSRVFWPARGSLRDDLREALNPLRSAWNAKGTAERYALPEVALFCSLLDANFAALPDGVKEQFGISRCKTETKAGKPTKASEVANGIRVERMAAALTCYLAVYTRDGVLRKNDEDGFIGVRFILDSIGMSSSYRPNMARSQLTQHGMRHYKGGRDGGFRSEYMRNLRHFFQYLRDSDSLTADSGLDSLMVHSVPVSSVGDSLTQDSGLDSLTPHSVPDETYKEAA